MPKFKPQALFIAIILVVGQSNLYAMNAGPSGPPADAQPSEDAFVYLPLVLDAYTLTSLVVTSASDEVNGDTSSPSALIANPGADGISLREAILAVNNGSGGAFAITFSPSLAGSVIVLNEQLLITQNHVTVAGFPDTSGQPAITIYNSEVPRGGFKVMGSYIVIQGLRMTGLRGQGGRAGVFLEPDSGGTVAHVRIENNLFEGTGANSSAGISLRNDDDTSAVTIKDVTIAGNTFSHFRCECDCIHIGSRGGNSLREDIFIRDNIFLDSNYPIELEASGPPSNHILNVEMTGNYFEGNAGAIYVNLVGDPGTEYTGNVISGTLIYDNVFEHNNDTVVSIWAGVSLSGCLSISGNTIQNTQIISNVIESNYQGIILGGGSDGASDNLLSDTLIARNVFVDNTNGAVGIAGGGRGGSTGNVVQNTQIINNLMAGNQDHAISVCGGWPNAPANRIEGVYIANNTIADNGTEEYDPAIGICISDPGSIVSGVEVVNSILWGNTTDFWSLVVALPVQYSITAQDGYAGVNGNIAADPLFVNPALGDYHLGAGSPAIDAGTSTGTPASDLECRARFDDPATPNTGAGAFTFYDMGAFEFNGPPAQCP